MKTRLRVALRALLTIPVCVMALPISSASPFPASPAFFSQNQEGGERSHVKEGPEVAKRVKQLQKFNKKVRKALADFERNEKRNGNKPKYDNSFSITINPTGGPPSSAALKKSNAPSHPFRKASLKSQDADYSGYGVEMIFVPTYDAPGEWQGTVIINQFDPSGAYLGQYVADVAMVPDSSGTFWDVFYEVSYDDDGESYLQYGNPNFELGTPRDLQDPAALQPLASRVSKPKFRKASFPATPQAGQPGGYRPRIPRLRWVMKCTVICSVGGAVGCGISSLFTEAVRSVRVRLGALEGARRFAYLRRSLAAKESLMQYLWLALAFLIGVIGILVGRVLGLSQPMTAGLAMVSNFVALFPFLKRWMPNMTFRYWILTTVIGATVAWFLYLGLAQLGF